MARIARFRSKAADANDISWKDVLEEVLKHMIVENSEDLMEQMVTVRRKRGTLLLDWVVTIAQLRATMWEISDLTTIRYITRQAVSVKGL